MAHPKQMERKVVEMLKAGQKASHVSEMTGVPKQTISRWKKIENAKKKERKAMLGQRTMVKEVTTMAEEKEMETPSTAGDMAHVYYSSKDYDKFSLIYFNRPVSEEKVQKLIKAIKEGKDYLCTYPIIVNSKFEIMDGQHRHEAAKRLGLPVYYIIDDVFKMEDAIAANVVTSNWTTKEYMDSFAVREFREYVKIQNFYFENPWMKISTLPKLCSSKGYGKLNFNNGHYVADRMEYAHKVAAMVNSFRPFIGDKQAEFNPFVQTVMNLAQNPNYSHKRMIEKMKQRGSLFQRCATVAQYLDILTQIYNYRVAPENRVLLTEWFIHQRWQRGESA